MTKQEICAELQIELADFERLAKTKKFPKPTGDQYDLQAVRAFLFPDQAGADQQTAQQTANPHDEGSAPEPEAVAAAPQLAPIVRHALEVPTQAGPWSMAILNCRGHIDMNLRGRRLAAFQHLAAGVFDAHSPERTDSNGLPVASWSSVMQVLLDKLADQLQLPND